MFRLHILMLTVLRCLASRTASTAVAVPLQAGRRHARGLLRDSVRFLFEHIAWSVNGELGLKPFQQPSHCLVTSYTLQTSDCLVTMIRAKDCRLGARKARDWGLRLVQPLPRRPHAPSPALSPQYDRSDVDPVQPRDAPPA